MIASSTNMAAPGPEARHAAEPRAPATARRRGRNANSKPGETTVPVHLPPDLVSGLQAWIASRPEPRPALSEVIRFALREWMMARQLCAHLGQSDASPARPMSPPPSPTLDPELAMPLPSPPDDTDGVIREAVA